MWATGVASGGRARAVAAALAVMLALVLAACGEDSSSDGGSSGSAGAGGEPVTLTVWDWDYFPSGLKPFLEQVDRAFEREHPNVTVKHVGIPYPDAPQKFQAAVAAQDGPDVMTLFPGAYAAGYKRGLVPLDDRITDEHRANWQFLSEAILPDGRTYVIPYAADGYVMAYNKRLFREAGIEPPATWDELLETCEQLKDAGIAPLTGGWKDGEHLSDYYVALSDALLTPDERSALYAADLPLDSPKLRAALDTFLDLDRRGCFADNSEARTHDDAIAAFAGGRAAMILQFISFGPLSKGGLFERQLGADGFGVFPVPAPPGAAEEQFMSLGPRTGWAVTRWSEQQDVAWEYIEFLMRDESFRLAWRTVRLLPNVRSFEPTSDFEPTQQFLEWMKWPANASTYAAYPGDVLDILVRQAPPLATGSIAPDELLAEMEEQLDRDRADLKG